MASCSSVPGSVAHKYISSFSGYTSAQGVIIPATEKHTATLIFLYGLGDTGYGMATFLQEIRIPHIKYFCPHAPLLQVTVNNERIMPAWFDKKNPGFGIDVEEDEPGIKSAAKKVHQWLEEEIKLGIPSDRIVLGGISQGGALALYSAFTYDKPLAGVVALSTYLPLHMQIPGERKENLGVSIFHAHGKADVQVPYAVAEFTANHIQSFNPQHTLRCYPKLQHWVCDEEMADLERFLTQLLSKTD